MATPTPTTLRHRTTVEPPSTLTLHTKPTSSTTTSSSSSSSSSSSAASSSSSSDYEMVSLKPISYTSLRDILPTNTTFNHSPKPPSFTSNSAYQISIRNRLVKQAAWAYLQPMSTSPGSHGSSIFHRLSDALFRFISKVFDCFLR